MNIAHIPRACGVYQINTPNGRYYIGKSEDMYARLKSHISDGNALRHGNRLLRNVFQKYGNEMTCEVLAITTPKHLEYLESCLIHMVFSDPKCMNLSARKPFEFEDFYKPKLPALRMCRLGIENDREFIAGIADAMRSSSGWASTTAVFRQYRAQGGQRGRSTVATELRRLRMTNPQPDNLKSSKTSYD